MVGVGRWCALSWIDVLNWTGAFQQPVWLWEWSLAGLDVMNSAGLDVMVVRNNGWHRAMTGTW